MGEVLGSIDQYLDKNNRQPSCGEWKMGSASMEIRDSPTQFMQQSEKGNRTIRGHGPWVLSRAHKNTRGSYALLVLSRVTQATS